MKLYQDIKDLDSLIEDLKKEAQLFKNKNSVLLTNATVFAFEKKKYLESVVNTLEKTILHESIKIPNLRNQNDAKVNDKMIQIIEKTAKDNQIPFSAFEEVFKDSEKTTTLFNLLRFDGKNNYQSENTDIENKIKNKLRR